MFGRGRDKARRAKEQDQQRKVAESQNALLTAAIATADTAHEVTTLLKTKLDEIVERFNQTARILRDALIICDSGGAIQFFNPAAEDLFGIPYKAALGTPVLRLFTGVHGEIVSTAELWVKFQNDDEADVLGVHTDGGVFPARVGFSVLERQGGANSILLLIRDHRTCGPCHEASRYAAIFETTFDGIVVAKDGAIVAANPACARLFGFSAAAMMGKPIADLVVERDRSRFLGLAGPAEHNLMIEGIHQSGRHLTLVFTVTEVKWDGGVATLITLRDITEMKRLERLVAMKRENGVDMVCSFDTTFRITFANQTYANCYGAIAKDLIGSDVRDLAEDRSVFEDVIHNLDLNTSSIRSFVRQGDDFQDWIDHAVFDEFGQPIEYQRVGRMICKSLTDVIKGG